MGYHVTRQNGYYDEKPRIEIATGKDEISPGMLVAQTELEDEYDTAQEAVEAAIELSKRLPVPPPITISSAASIGLYPTSDDGCTTEELYQWAHARGSADKGFPDPDEY